MTCNHDPLLAYHWKRQLTLNFKPNVLHNFLLHEPKHAKAARIRIQQAMIVPQQYAAAGKTLSKAVHC